MNKKMKEILRKIEDKTSLVKGYMTDGEGKDVEKATAILNEIDELEAEYKAEKKLFELSKKENIPSAMELEKTKRGTMKTM